MRQVSCPLCGNACDADLKIPSEGKEGGNRFDCSICGNFIVYDSVIWNGLTVVTPNLNIAKIKNQRYNLIAEFLTRSPNYQGKKVYEFFCNEDAIGQQPSEPFLINIAEHIKNYPKNLNDRLNRILLNLSCKYSSIGDEFDYSSLTAGLLFAETDRGNDIKEKDTIIEFLTNSNYLTELLPADGSAPTKYKLTEKAWEKINTLTQENSLNKDVFVAMSFHESTSPTREAIRKAIVNADFSATFMDEIIHNHQIIPEMLRLIKESRFLIMDISDPNYGAYYEAGFALGLGKEVIITCKNTVFKKKSYKSWVQEKAYKPHFDIAQKQILVWNDETDLTKKLQEWIKYLFPN